MRGIGALLVLVCLLASASGAGAQDEAEARRLYARGAELARTEGRCGDAIEFFRRAIAIRETPQRVLSLAACLAATGQHVEAIATFSRYLEMDGLSAAERGAARRALADEHRAVGMLTLTLDPPRADVFVDGVHREGVGSPRLLLLDPGSHALEVRAEGYVAHRVEVSALPGARDRQEIALTPDRRAAPWVRIETDPADAEILIDGVVVGRGRHEGPLTEGRHRIEARAEGFLAFREDIDAAPREVVRVHARLGAHVERSGGADRVATTSPPSDQSAGTAALIAASALTVVGLGLTAAAIWSLVDTLDGLPAYEASPTLASFADLNARADRTDVLGAFAAGTLVVAVVFWPLAAMWLSGSGAEASIAFDVAVGPDGNWARLRLRW